MSENTSFFDEALAQRISYAIGAAHAIKDLDQRGLKGSFREMILGEILEPLLPGTCGVYHGTVISSYPSSRKKTEDDLLIVDRECLPPLLYSERDGIFPIESVLARIEVKSVLTIEELSSAVTGCQEFSKLEMNIMDDSGITKEVNNTMQGIFAYCSRIHDELEHLPKYSRCTANPPLRFLCVVRKGMWIWGRRKKPDEGNGWLFCRPDKRHSEIVSMLALMLDSLPFIRQKRKAAVFGNYIFCLRSDRLEEIPSI